jgi:hypothetical protein
MVREGLDDALLLVATIVAFPLAILVIGTPIVLMVRVVIAMAHQLH